MSVINTEGTALTDEEVAAFAPRVSDQDLAREYALMLEDIYVHADDLDAETCPPDRRLFKADKEAWVYDHGKIAELVFVVRD